MLKLPKGLKKKKKGKKSKKDQELFTEEEFEQYKREHQAHPEASEGTHQQQHQHQQEENPEKAKGSENDEEWSRFAALTSDIDSILKKTQANLDHIKTTSFFQRVPSASQKKVEEQKRAEEEAEEKRKQEEAARREQEEADRDPVKQLLNAVVELSDSEEESDVDDSAFDTTFIDKVEAGELPLAYVAEEDEEEVDLGPDPFDTGYAEKVIKGPDVSARGKKIVDIGAAVGVLTGKVEAAASTVTKNRRQRRGIQNLLLESFEAELEGEAGAAAVDGEASTSRTLLDEPPELADNVPIDLSVSLHLALKPKAEDEPDKDLDEFDVVKDDDELLVAAKKVIESDQDKAKAAVPAADLDWSEFELEREKPLRPPVPVRPALPVLGSDDEFDLADDPFDTAYVEKIVPKPIDYDEDFDPRAADEEEEEDDFNPRADEEDLFNSEGKPAAAAGLAAARNDLLSTSHSDLASIAPTLAPSAEQEEEEEIDPFDTSAVDRLVAPGKTELKYLEKEFLESSEQKKESLSDDDFDPRAEEEPPRPSAEALKHRKSSLSLQIPGTKLVSFSVTSPDLLKTDSEANHKHQKPLTPFYNRESSLQFEEEEEPAEVDPFDTSFVPSIAPTSVELDLIEKEILEKKAPQSIDYDDDFDPRAVTPEPPAPKTDLLLAPDNHDRKVLTPAGKDITPEEVDIDPFDTSIANNIVPGTTELKLLEDELIEKKPDAPPPTDILSDTQDNSIYVKILTPQPTGSLELDADPDDFDPFDTSFATNLAPGETEIKLIESELIN